MARSGPSEPSPRLLADIGGTHARFALADAGGSCRQVAVLEGRDHPDLEAAARAYLERAAPDSEPRAAAFAVACPVAGDRVALTNSPWTFSIEELKRALGLHSLRVVNDFTAVALAAPRLGPDQLEKIGGGDATPAAPIGVIGPGTGLGVSGLVPAAEDWVALSGEGGHATLAPASALESDVLARARRRFGHVSAERLISGPGLVTLYEILGELGAAEGPPPEGLTPELVSRRAIDGLCPLSAAALDMFCAMLGTAAANLALTLGALGGIYVAGGVVPALGPAFAASPFRRRFEDQGRFSAYLAAIPTFVVRHETPAFIGLAALLDREAV